MLILDANVHAAETIGCWLEMAACRVVTAYDGQAALTEARRFLPHAVIIDSEMPGLDVFELVGALRALPNGARMTIVALTLDRSVEYSRYVREASIDHYLMKPAQPLELRKLIVQHSGNAPARHPLPTAQAAA